MFRCAGVVLALALVFFAQGVAAEPLDGAGMIGGIVSTETGIALDSAIITVCTAGSTIDTLGADTTDSAGGYAILIDVDESDTVWVDVYAQADLRIDSVVTDTFVVFLEVTRIDFVLRKAAQPLSGYVFESVFEEGIESVYVDTGDPETSEYTDSDGYYNVEVGEPGFYNILFTHPDFETVADTVTLSNARVPYSNDTLWMEQVIWHVDTWGSDEAGKGTWWNPFATFQTAIDTAGTADTVLVGPGTYGPELNGGISFKGKQIVVMSDSTFGPELTIVDCINQNRGFVFENQENSLSILRGFTIRNGRTAGSGGAILCRDSSPTIEDCIVEDNYASDRGGGIAVQTITTSPIFRRCIINNNSARERGGGIYFFEYCNPTLENCTVFGNSADSTNGRGGGISSIMCDATITNCIIWGNSDYYLGDNTDQIDTATSVPIIEYCDVQGGWDGEGNLDHNPWFCDPDARDFTLADNSICVGAGEGGVDIGARGVGDCGSIGVIIGTVVDSLTGDPLDSALAVATSSGGAVIRRDSTNSNGDYELTIPWAPDVADIDFLCNGYRDTTIYNVPFFPSDTTLLDTVKMSSGCIYIPGDVDNNGVALEIADVSAIICYYRGECLPPLECFCQDAGRIYVTADPNGSCIPLELGDVLQEICAYRGNCLAYGCSDCPGAGPPPPGACCFGLNCEFTSTRQECWDQGGEWHYFATCPEFDCSTVPAPPAGASVVPSLKSKVRIDRGGLTQ